MAKVHAITFLISREYVSVNWSDSSLKHEMYPMISEKGALVLILEQVSSGLKVLSLEYKSLWKKIYIFLDIAFLQEETTALA